jgi:glycosidase
MKWYEKSFIYHVYPLGFDGCLGKCESEHDKFKKLKKNIDYIKSIGADSVFFGPVFESSSHGYDVNDLFNIDKRLGTNQDFKELCDYIHQNGLKIILDSVFHHCGRGFERFLDLKEKKQESCYKDWFYGVDFSQNNSYNDGFTYHGWNGDCSLVKYNLFNQDVVRYLLSAVKFWVEEFGVDGLRLDAADCLEYSFLEQLRQFCDNMDNDIWLMGEVVHGDYREFVSDAKLNATTNYECYKGLYSSFNDKNMFEIAYSLKRQFGKDGIYKKMHLYNFADNHDVNRIFSTLKEKVHIFPLYILLFTMPGIPSVYYGSEFRIEGLKGNNDSVLRPDIDMTELFGKVPLDIYDTVKKLSDLRKNNTPVIDGDYKELMVSSEQFFFERKNNDGIIIAGINSAHTHKRVSVRTGNEGDNRSFVDILNNNEEYHEKNGIIELNMFPTWGVILKMIN